MRILKQKLFIYTFKLWEQNQKAADLVVSHLAVHVGFDIVLIEKRVVVSVVVLLVVGGCRIRIVRRCSAVTSAVAAVGWRAHHRRIVVVGRCQRSSVTDVMINRRRSVVRRTVRMSRSRFVATSSVRWWWCLVPVSLLMTVRCRVVAATATRLLIRWTAVTGPLILLLLTTRIWTVIALTKRDEN